jgi:glycosyltransferase involved in cell wall biosynthesis
MKLRIAILGTRGIPNQYGGFEQITEDLSVGLVKRGHEVTVYNTHNHTNQKKRWKGVKIVHCYDPVYLKTAGQFIYDLNCIRHARRQQYDIWLFMGYTSSSIWASLFPRNAVIISNMDGLEWKRDKYSKPVQHFLRQAEKWAVLRSHFHIADSRGIEKYLKIRYGIEAQYIPYGARLSRKEQAGTLEKFELREKSYYVLMARMEPENNVELILDGFHESNSACRFLVIGNTGNRYGQHLVKKFKGDHRIIFAGPIFDQDMVHTLRKHAILYFHGHSVGGTNPSLLEAMASRVSIAAHDNVFNRCILGHDAFYFHDSCDVTQIIQACSAEQTDMVRENYRKIYTTYNWGRIIDEYEQFICQCFQRAKHETPVYHRRFAYQ